MKYIFFLIVNINLFINIYSQISENNDISLRDSVIYKMSTDTVIYNQFLLLGKCLCSDIIDSTSNYNAVYDELYSLWTPFPKILGNEKGKIILEKYLEDYIKNKYPEELKYMMLNDEIGRKKHNTIILCERMFLYKSSWEIYLKFIHQSNVIFGIKHHLNMYLKPDSHVLNRDGW